MTSSLGHSGQKCKSAIFNAFLSFTCLQISYSGSKLHIRTSCCMHLSAFWDCWAIQSMPSWWCHGEEAEINSESSFQASAHVTAVNVLWARASLVAKHRVKGGEYTLLSRMVSPALVERGCILFLGMLGEESMYLLPIRYTTLENQLMEEAYL